MSIRKYTAIVTVTLVSPEGKHLGTATDAASLEIGMDEFQFNNVDADEYITGELGTMLASATFKIC